MPTTSDMHWNAALYDDKHAFVFRYGNDVLKLLDPQQGEHILDIGCGTGHLTAKIAAAGAIVTGIDSSASMIAQAKSNYPDIDFEVQDATGFTYNQPFDAVFSNATLHWIPEAAKVIACVYNSLKPGGRFVAEMGVQGNVDNIINAIRKVLQANGYAERAAKKIWYFPSLGAYASLLEQAGFRVRFATSFDRETLLEDKENGIADWINMFGAAFLEGIREQEREALVLEMQEAIRPASYRDGRWYADYKRLRFVALK